LSFSILLGFKNFQYAIFSNAFPSASRIPALNFVLSLQARGVSNHFLSTKRSVLQPASGQVISRFRAALDTYDTLHQKYNTFISKPIPNKGHSKQQIITRSFSDLFNVLHRALPTCCVHNAQYPPQWAWTDKPQN